MKKLCAVMMSAMLLTACGKETELVDDLDATKPINVYTAQKDETTTAAVSAVEPSRTTLVGLAENKAKEDNSADNSADNKAETIETEGIEDSTGQEYTDGEEQLLRFLECLQTGEGEPFEYGDPLDVYDFMDDFTLDDYSYTYRGDGIYDVTLTCSDSTVDIFPDGKSEWVFNSTYLTCFIPAEREENHNIRLSFGDPDYDGTDSLMYSAYEAAYNFSKCIGGYEADSEWFENFDVSNGEYSAEQYVHWIYHAYNPYFTVYDQKTGEYYDVTPEEFAAAVKKLYNVNITAEQAKSMTDETGFMIKNCGHGISWLYSDFAGYEETENEVKVRINYYGDSLYFYPTVQSEYTFSKNDDGSITLQRVEKIFDRGYEIAGDST